MSDRTVSWIVTAAFAGALTLMMVTGCTSTPAPAASAPKAAQKSKSHRKPAGKKPSTHKVCGWGDTGRWECHEAPISEDAPDDDEQWDEL